MGRCRLVGGGSRDVVGLRLVVVVVVAALAALIISPSESMGDRLEWGRRRLTQSSSAAAVKRRSDVDDDLRPLLWWKFRGSTRPTEQRTNLMKLLLHGVGSSLRQRSPLLQSTQWTNIDRNSLLHLIRDAPPSSYSSSFSFSSSGESDPPGGSLQSEILGDVAPSPRHASEFLDAAQYFRNLGRPRSRRNPPSSRSGAYEAPHENRYSSGGDAAERRRLVFAGARRILAEPEVETTRQPMKKRRVWRRLRSLDDPPQNDDDDLLRMVSWKRQPPPGFHAIRGKRDSETEERGERDGEEEEEDEEDEEEGEEEDGEEREEEAINRWIRQTARRIGLDSEKQQAF